MGLLALHKVLEDIGGMSCERTFSFFSGFFGVFVRGGLVHTFSFGVSTIFWMGYGVLFGWLLTLKLGEVVGFFVSGLFMRSTVSNLL